MAIKVMIPTALRQFADGRDTVELAGANVGQILEQLGQTFPELKRHLFSDDGVLRNFVNVYINDENIRDRNDRDTPLKDGDELTIVPAIAGGVGNSDASSLRFTGTLAPAVDFKPARQRETGHCTLRTRWGG
jgi:adenylyltransferase/sulfurtransferase